MAFWNKTKKDDETDNIMSNSEESAQNETAEDVQLEIVDMAEAQDAEEYVPQAEAEIVNEIPAKEEKPKSEKELKKELKELKKAQKEEKKAKKKPITGFGVFLIVLFINAVWVAAAAFYFFPMYNDDIWQREAQIEEYENKMQSLQAIYDSMVKEYDTKIEALEERLEAQDQRYIDAVKLIEKYEIKLEEERLEKEKLQQQAADGQAQNSETLNSEIDSGNENNSSQEGTN